MRPFALNIAASDSPFAAGHRRIAIRLRSINLKVSAESLAGFSYIKAPSWGELMREGAREGAREGVS
jgi:hypothetical protein